MYKKPPRMDRENRAKQFMPFDALKGFREALEEKEQEFFEFYQCTKKDACGILIEESEESCNDI